MSTPSRLTLGGVALFMLGIFLLACTDTITKYLAALYPALLVVAMRYVGQLVLMLLMAPAHGRSMLQTRRTGLVLFRATCLAAASLTLTLALQRMPVAETSAIVFLFPILVILLAGTVLREHIDPTGWLAAIAGFIGVLLIARPGSGLDALGVAFALLSAVFNAVYHLLSRVLARTEQTMALMFYTGLVGTVCFGLTLPWYWPEYLPPLTHLALFCCTGLLAGTGHLLLTAAHRHSPASALAPMLYVHLIWAALFGWLVFSHVPDGFGILGMLIIAAAGALVALKSRLASRSMLQAAKG